jgi:hypothetical protein
MKTIADSSTKAIAAVNSSDFFTISSTSQIETTPFLLGQLLTLYVQA